MQPSSLFDMIAKRFERFRRFLIPCINLNNRLRSQDILSSGCKKLFMGDFYASLHKNHYRYSSSQGERRVENSRILEIDLPDGSAYVFPAATLKCFDQGLFSWIPEKSSVAENTWFFIFLRAIERLCGQLREVRENATQLHYCQFYRTTAFPDDRDPSSCSWII
jgi:hypothetical protein